MYTGEQPGTQTPQRTPLFLFFLIETSTFVS